jgi:hypothetical protein
MNPHAKMRDAPKGGIRTQYGSKGMMTRAGYQGRGEGP